jgi:putative PIN family toxin of toxin-antitoxin system
VQAILDPNVIISGLLSAQGTSAQILRAFRDGDFEIVLCAQLLAELARALAYPKLRRHISEQEAASVLAWLQKTAISLPDPDRPPPCRSKDPGDDYLVALAGRSRLALVSGDKDLLELAGQIPVFTPREFLDMLTGRGERGV